MRNFTKILMILSLVLFCYPTHVQAFCIKGGLNLANMLDIDDDGIYNTDYTMNPGFHLGLTVDVPIEEFLSFESGLLLTTKGMNYEYEKMGADVKINANLYYLEVPLTIKEYHDLGSGLKMYTAVGPYIGLALSGKVKYTLDEETQEIDIDWGNDEYEDTFKRLDMGLTIGTGIEINALVVGISYDLGLSNISSYQDNRTIVKNRVLKFSLGYKF